MQVSSLHWAAASGRLDDVRHLLTTDVKIVNSRDEKQVRTSIPQLPCIYPSGNVHMHIISFCTLHREPHCTVQLWRVISVLWSILWSKEHMLTARMKIMYGGLTICAPCLH